MRSWRLTRSPVRMADSRSRARGSSSRRSGTSGWSRSSGAATTRRSRSSTTATTPRVLSYCRHMLGSRDEAEDALQQTFVSAHADIVSSDKPIRFKAWIFTIARNRCLSILRARREQPSEDLERVSTAGLGEEVQQRAELRELLADMHELPDDQRAALILSELGDLSHAEVAEVIDCEVAKVKSLVFQARSGLMERRQARETPCEEIREQLATLRGGSLRRGPLRRHLKACPGCTEFRERGPPPAPDGRGRAAGRADARAQGQRARGGRHQRELRGRRRAGRRRRRCRVRRQGRRREGRRDRGGHDRGRRRRGRGRADDPPAAGNPGRGGDAQSEGAGAVSGAERRQRGR